MFGAADLLASEYGWQLDYIMNNIYPDTFFMLVRQIRMRRIDDNLLQIAIFSQAQSEDRDFMDELIRQQRFMRGIDIHEKLDREAVEQFRRQFMGSKNIGVKKVK